MHLTRSTITPLGGQVPSCYFASKLPSTEGQPCNRSSPISNCCAIGWVCLDNGLCQKGGRISSGSCTDPDFSDAAACPAHCPGLCSFPFTSQTRFSAWDKFELTVSVDNPKSTRIVFCKDVTDDPLDFCCSNDDNCCSTGIGRRRLKSTGVPYREILSEEALSPSTTMARSSSMTRIIGPVTDWVVPASSSPTNTQRPSKSTNLSLGSKIGIGSGAAIGIIAISTILSILLFQKFRRKRVRILEARIELDTQAKKPKVELPQSRDNGLYPEIDGSVMGANELGTYQNGELRAHEVAHELPGRT